MCTTAIEVGTVSDREDHTRIRLVHAPWLDQTAQPKPFTGGEVGTLGVCFAGYQVVDEVVGEVSPQQERDDHQQQAERRDQKGAIGHGSPIRCATSQDSGSEYETCAIDGNGAVRDDVAEKRPIRYP